MLESWANKVFQCKFIRSDGFVNFPLASLPLLSLLTLPHPPPCSSPLSLLPEI